MVPFSLLYGNETVRQTVDGDFTGDFVNKVIDEINGTLAMNKNEVNNYAEEVMDRFRNPFIIHKLSDIALNSVSKFKVRVLPSLLQYVENNKQLPVHLTYSLACLTQFYKGSWKNEVLPINDNAEIVSFFKEIWRSNNFSKITNKVLGNIEFWEQDLTQIKGLSEAIILALNEIDTNGIEKGFLNFKNKFNS